MGGIAISSLECGDGLGEGGGLSVDADVDAAVAEEHVALSAAVERRAQRHVVHLEKVLWKKMLVSNPYTA